MIYIILLIICLIGLLFLQYHLSRKQNPILGLIVPVLYFLVSWLATGIITGGGFGFLRYIRWFFIANIPTAIYLIIYFIVRYNIRCKVDLNKMKAQDLR